MVYQRCGLGMSYRQIGEQLNVDPSTICRTVQLFEETGTVHSIQGYHENTTTKLTAQDELAIIEALLDNPSMYLHKLQHTISYLVVLVSVLPPLVTFYINKIFRGTSLPSQHSRGMRS